MDTFIVAHLRTRAIHKLRHAEGGGGGISQCDDTLSIHRESVRTGIF